MLDQLAHVFPWITHASATAGAEAAVGGSVLVALVTLTVLEIVLGVDNVIFIAILASKLPVHEQARARRIGIAAAVLTRILLLLSISWVMRLTEPLLTILSKPISGRDLILLGGGLFLIAKATYEIHDKLEAAERPHAVRAVASLRGVIVQIMLVDVVFSLDSVITAIGLADELWVMITAILISAGIMVAAAGYISDFVERHPTMKILALSFLILIGSLLVIEGWNPDLAHELGLKNYAYFAMAFSVAVELVNMRVRRSAEPVQLRRTHLPETPPADAASAPG